MSVDNLIPNNFPTHKQCKEKKSSWKFPVEYFISKLNTTYSYR